MTDKKRFLTHSAFIFSQSRLTKLVLDQQRVPITFMASGTVKGKGCFIKHEEIHSTTITKIRSEIKHIEGF